MTAFKQREGTKGSLKWIQVAVNDRPNLIDDAIRKATGLTGAISWKSPLRAKDFAEYRDAAFLDQIGQAELGSALEDFWPQRGPQWDALAIAGASPILVEAKSHIPEMCSPPSAAGETSKAKIAKSLSEASAGLGASPAVPWGPYFYQLANRLAHLWFLQSKGIDAKLVLVNFVGDLEQGGPSSQAEWEAAYSVANHVLDLPRRGKFSSAVAHVYLNVNDLK